MDSVDSWGPAATSLGATLGKGVLAARVHKQHEYYSTFLTKFLPHRVVQLVTECLHQLVERDTLNVQVVRVDQLGATRQYLTVAILVYAALMLWVVSSTKLVLSDSGEYSACIKRPKIDECWDVIMLLSCRLGVQPRVPEGRLPMGRA